MFTTAFFFDIMKLVSGRLAQLVEHSLDVRKVSGSSPLTSTMLFINFFKLPYIYGGYVFAFRRIL